MADNTEKTGAENAEKKGAENAENGEKTEKKDGLITRPMRNAIKKMAEISKCAEALSLMPTPEEFALMLINDLRSIVKKVNSIQTRIYGLLDRYMSIPTEFLLQGFDEVLDQLKNISETAKFAIAETTGVLSNVTMGVKDITDAVGDAVSTTTSAVLQVGGGISYGAAAMGANLKLAMTGGGVRTITENVVQDVLNGNVSVADMNAEIENRYKDSYEESGAASADAIKDSTKNAAKNATDAIDSFFDGAGDGLKDAIDWIDGVKDSANGFVDDTVGELIKKVENAKKKVEEAINRVKSIFDKFLKDFNDSFGSIVGAEDALINVTDTAKEMGSNKDSSMSPVFNAIGGLSEDVTKFIKNFNIAKIITGLGGLFVGAGAATLALDLLPNVDIDKMLKDIIGGVNRDNEKRKDKMKELERSKYSDVGVELSKVPDFPWQMSKDDLEKYNAKGYNEFLKKYSYLNDEKRVNFIQNLKPLPGNPPINAAIESVKKNLESESKSALKELRKVRRAAIKARQIEKYKGFLNTELEYLKNEFDDVKNNIERDWNTMMKQYTTALSEVNKFFTKDGYGGNDKIDKCCNRINEDAEKILELCSSITVELTSTVSNVAVPYSIGTCVDMPVHKVLEFFKDVKYILTFLKDLIKLGLDIISQISILVGIIVSGLKSIKDIMNKLRKLIGVDAILQMIEFIVSLFRQKMVDAKILLENSISPIYYNETEDYEQKAEAIEALLDDDMDGGEVEVFKYSDDVNAKKKHKKEFGGKLSTDDDIEDVLEEFEAKGEREVVAYRSPILNAAGDDFAGWIYYHAYAYDNMKKSWSSGKKRRRNKLIKKASKKNKMRGKKLVGGVAQLKRNKSFGKYDGGKYIKNSVTGYDAYYWYTKWTNDPTDCTPDMENKGVDIVVPVQTTSNGSLVELSDGRRVFVEGKIVQSGDYVKVDGVKYRVK